MLTRDDGSPSRRQSARHPEVAALGTPIAVPELETNIGTSRGVSVEGTSMDFRSSRDVTLPTHHVSIRRAQRDARPLRRLRPDAAAVPNLAVVDILRAILRAFRFVARVPVQAPPRRIPAGQRWGA